MPIAEHHVEPPPKLTAPENFHATMATAAAGASLKLSQDAIKIGSSIHAGSDLEAVKVQAPKASALDTKAEKQEVALAKQAEKVEKQDVKQEKQEEKEEKRREREEEHEKGGKLKEPHEKEHQLKLPKLEIHASMSERKQKDEKRDTKEKTIPHDHDPKCTKGTDGPIKYVGDEPNGAYFRQTNCDANGKPIVLNFDKDQKLTTKMWTRPDGVTAYEDYVSTDKQKNNGTSKPSSAANSSSKPEAPTQISEEKAKEQQFLKSEMLEFPDLHTEFHNHNADGSYQVRSAYNKDMVDSTTNYDRKGHIISSEKIDWKSFTGK